MTDYISREMTIDAICRLCNANFEEDPCEPSECEMMSLLRKIPAADVRPVVFCKDCVYLSHDKHGAWCFNNYEANLKDDDFCSYGKRKEKQT